MSRTTVRAAIATYLSGANITGLAAVYQAKPTFFPGELLDLSADNASGAFAWVDLGPSDEDRWSVPAAYAGYTGSGDKGVHYDASILVEYQYLIPQQTSSPVSPDDWVHAEDAILQAIKDRFHADAQLGNSGVVFSAGQNPNGLRISEDDPYLESGKVVSIHAVYLRVTEAIQA